MRQNLCANLIAYELWAFMCACVWVCMSVKVFTMLVEKNQAKEIPPRCTLSKEAKLNEFARSSKSRREMASISGHDNDEYLCATIIHNTHRHKYIIIISTYVVSSYLLLDHFSRPFSSQGNGFSHFFFVSLSSSSWFLWKTVWLSLLHKREHKAFATG